MASFSPISTYIDGRYRVALLPSETHLCTDMRRLNSSLNCSSQKSIIVRSNLIDCPTARPAAHYVVKREERVSVSIIHLS